MNKIIHSSNLSKVYGEKETIVTALDDISVEFSENEFTKNSSFTPFIGSGLSYQYGSDALASVQTGEETTNFTITADGIWAIQLSGGLAYEITKDIEIVVETGLAIPLSESDLPEGWSEESPTVSGFSFGLIYSF